MHKYRVIVKTIGTGTENGALQNIVRFDPEARFELQDQNEMVEVYEIATCCDIEHLLDVSEGVISYILV